MSKLRQQLDEYQNQLDGFRGVYLLDGTITKEEQDHLEALDAKILAVRMLLTVEATAGKALRAGANALQAAAKSAYDVKLTGIMPELINILYDNHPEATAKVREQIRTDYGHMESAALKGDYITANQHLDVLTRLLSEYRAVRNRELKQQYDAARPKIRLWLEKALGKSWKNKDMTRLQDKIRTKKDETDEAAAKENYELALKHLEILAEWVDQFNRTRPRDCGWVNGAATAVLNKVMRTYIPASLTLTNAANAFDKALEAHEESLNSKTSLAAELLTGLFFAALGGLAGGAFGIVVTRALKKTPLHKSIEESIEKTKTGAALIDASNEVAKFAIHSMRSYGGDNSGTNDKPGRFGTSRISLGGSGADLAKNFGEALNEEAQKLLDVVKELTDQVMNTNCKYEDIIIEGNPVEKLEEDPFLKILSELPGVDQVAFAKVIWKAWIEQNKDSRKVVEVHQDIIKQTGNDAEIVVPLIEIVDRLTDFESNYIM